MLVVLFDKSLLCNNEYFCAYWIIIIIIAMIINNNFFLLPFFFFNNIQHHPTLLLYLPPKHMLTLRRPSTTKTSKLQPTVSSYVVKYIVGYAMKWMSLFVATVALAVGSTEATSLWSLNATDDGEVVNFEQFSGSVALVINVATY